MILTVMSISMFVFDISNTFGMSHFWSLYKEHNMLAKETAGQIFIYFRNLFSKITHLFSLITRISKVINLQSPVINQSQSQVVVGISFGGA